MKRTLRFGSPYFITIQNDDKMFKNMSPRIMFCTDYVCTKYFYVMVLISNILLMFSNIA